MTKKLYDEAPYETEFTATVLKCEVKSNGCFDIILDQTLFFPEEGGQTPDLGFICVRNSAENSCFEVIDVQIDKSNTITHRVKPVNGCIQFNDNADFELQKNVENRHCHPAEGMQINGKVDWKRRFYNMQQHSGEHIFSGLVDSLFGYSNVGFHLSDNDVTMDYDGTLTKDDILKLEYAANDVISRNVPVTCYYPDAAELKSLNYRSKKELEGPIRIVKIEGCDMCACCAPHVKLTGEVGIFKVISFQSWKGGTRVYALCGFRALEEFNKLQDAAYEVSHEFSVPVSKENFAAVFEKQREAVSTLKTKISALESQLLDLQIEKEKNDSKNIILFTDGFSDILRRNKINELVSSCKGFCCIFDGNDACGYSFIIASSTINCNDIIKTMKEHFEARGGGKPNIVQGHVKGTKAALSDLLTTLRD